MNRVDPIAVAAVSPRFAELSGAVKGGVGTPLPYRDIQATLADYRKTPPTGFATPGLEALARMQAAVDEVGEEKLEREGERV
jgi:hypothetical protein